MLINIEAHYLENTTMNKVEETSYSLKFKNDSEGIEILYKRFAENLYSYAIVPWKLTENKLQFSDIVDRTGLTFEMIQQIKNDTIFPNQIPLLLMKKLIEFLDMNFNEVKLALKQTVNYLFTQTQEPKTEISTSLLYSRRFKDRKKHSVKFNQQFNSFDYSNAQKALEIYLKRLEKILIFKKTKRRS